MNHLAVGDHVKYSRSFLRSTGIFTGEIPFARGRVASFELLGENILVKVDWENKYIPRRVLSCNLVRVGDVESV